MTLYYQSQYFTTTLSVGGGINSTQTTGIVAQSTSGVFDLTKPGIACLTWSNPLNTTTAEYFSFTSINPSTKEFNGVTRGIEGFSARSHLNGATIAFIHSKSHINELNKLLDGSASGAVLVTPVVDDGMLLNHESSVSTPASGKLAIYAKNDNKLYRKGSDGTEAEVGSSATVATQAEVATGTDNTKMVTPLAAQALGNVGGWIPATGTWTYASASTITVPSGAASIYQKGDRIKFTQTTVKYGVIVAVADTLLTIAVNTDYTVANAAISDVYYSHEASPVGYPGSFNWTTTWGGFSANPTGTFKYNIIGNTCWMEYSDGAAGTSNATTLTFTVPVAPLRSDSNAGLLFVKDNSSNLATPGHMIFSAGSTTVQVYKAFYGTVFTASGTKDIYLSNLMIVF